MTEDTDSYLSEFEGSRFHTYDKIDYRRTIHKLVERCLLSTSSTFYNSYVQDLIDAIDFDLRGYPLHSLMENQSEQVLIELDKEKNNWINNHPHEWNHPMKSGIKQADWDKKYYRKMFKYIHQLLASRGLYLKSGKKIEGGKQMKYPGE